MKATFDHNVTYAVNRGMTIATEAHKAYYTEEYVFLAMLEIEVFATTLRSQGLNIQKLREKILAWLDEHVPAGGHENSEPEETSALQELFRATLDMAEEDGCTRAGLDQLTYALAEGNSYVLQAVAEMGTTMEDIGDRLVPNLIASSHILPDDEMITDEGLVPEDDSDWRKYVQPILQTDDKTHPTPPFIGRKQELTRMCEVLCRKDKCNPMIIGESGVGKTALVELGLKHLIESNQAPAILEKAPIFKLNLAAITAGSTYRGMLESRLLNVMSAMKEMGNAILFIDDAHTLFGPGGQKQGETSKEDLIKGYLEGSGIRFITATTPKEYRRVIENDPMFARRFQSIVLEEPSQQEAIEILEGIKGQYEHFHNVVFPLETIKETVRLTSAYVKERLLPDKAIDILDEVGASINMHQRPERTISKADIEQAVSHICRIPLSTLQEDTLDRLATLEETLKNNVFGQDEAAERITAAIQMSHAGLQEENKPIASYLFVGPTGVGKTEEVKVLAKAMQMNLIRLDMSEYQDQSSAAKLFGSPAGYVGYEDGGILTNAVRNQPNSVVLFDEVEKAHSSVYDALLQIMDEAKLTDNKGRAADFRNCIIIMTSNAGATGMNQRRIGTLEEFHTGSIDDAVKKTFKPEFIGRLSGVIKFNPLSERLAQQIARRELQKLSDRLLSTRGIHLSFDPSLIAHIAKQGYSPTKGARQIVHVITKEVAQPLVKEILYGSLKEGGKAVVKWTSAGFAVSPIKKAAAALA